MNKRQTAYLVLENGRIFQGQVLGKKGTSIGEIVFNTNTASYEDILSDPTYYGQIVAQTYPLGGNRGVSGSRLSNITASGYIVREWYDEPKSPNGRVSLDEFLKQRSIVGLCAIDTRRLTRMLRDGGYIKAAITDTIEDIPSLIRQMHSYSISGAVEAVTCRQREDYTADGERYRMAVMDYGFNRRSIPWLLKRGISLAVFPAHTCFEEIMNAFGDRPDGVMLSDGPGDPDDDPVILEEIRRLSQTGITLFGVGLGHQMLALCCGMSCEKMSQGHRGANQPVRRISDGRLMVTCQNHGYAVSRDSVDEKIADIVLENVNDGTVEALSYKAFPAFTVQFEPMDGKGYQDTAWIFDWLTELLGGKAHA